MPKPVMTLLKAINCLLSVSKAFSLIFVLGISSLTAAAKLPTDYYARDNTVVGVKTLYELLNKHPLGEAQIQLLVSLLEASSPSRIQQISADIANLSENNPQADDIVLLIDLKEELLVERQLIIDRVKNSFLSESDKQAVNTLASVVVQNGSDGELNSMLLLICDSLVNRGGDPDSLFYTAINSALSRGLIPEHSAIKTTLVEIVRRLSVSDDKMFTVPQSRVLLAKLDPEFASKIILQSLAVCVDPSANITKLSQSIPDLFQFLIISSDKEAAFSTEKIGINVKRFRHSKIRKLFFTNVIRLVKRLDNKDIRLRQYLSEYLSGQQTDSDMEWSQFAKETSLAARKLKK